MVKKGKTSWFTVVKKAFRSPTKGADAKSCKTREESDPDDQDIKRREKPRWIFRKATMDQHQHQHQHKHQQEQNVKKDQQSRDPITTTSDQAQALAAAVAAAEAAAATAQAAARIARFNRRSSFANERTISAVTVQTAFRGYLARRALRALKGIVRLQAFIRGENTRRQARETLKCMEAMIRMQGQIYEQQKKITSERSRKSMFAETNNLWDRYMQDIRQRKSISNKERSTADQWGGFPCIFEEQEAKTQGRKDAADKSDRSLAHAFSQQIRRSGSARTLRGEEEANERTDWLNQWMEKKQWEEYTSRGSTDKRDSIKTVQMDTVVLTPHSYTNRVGVTQRSPSPHQNRHRREPSPQPRQSLSNSMPSPLQARPESPRSVREGRSHSSANTPSLKSRYTYTRGSSSCGTMANTPRYMASTESAKAKVRSVSTPRQRPSTPSRERGGSARKRLSYPINEYGSFCTDNSSFSHSLRSPSFRSVCPAIERGAYQSYYTESTCGEVSPASTTQIRRWLN